MLNLLATLAEYFFLWGKHNRLHRSLELPPISIIHPCQRFMVSAFAAKVTFTYITNGEFVVSLSGIHGIHFATLYFEITQHSLN